MFDKSLNYLDAQIGTMPSGAYRAQLEEVRNEILDFLNLHTETRKNKRLPVCAMLFKHPGVEEWAALETLSGYHVGVALGQLSEPEALVRRSDVISLLGELALSPSKVHVPTYAPAYKSKLSGIPNETQSSDYTEGWNDACRESVAYARKVAEHAEKLIAESLTARNAATYLMTEAVDANKKLDEVNAKLMAMPSQEEAMQNEIDLAKFKKRYEYLVSWFFGFVPETSERLQQALSPQELQDRIDERLKVISLDSPFSREVADETQDHQS